jgi:hypothetical protein
LSRRGCSSVSSKLSNLASADDSFEDDDEDDGVFGANAGLMSLLSDHSGSGATKAKKATAAKKKAKAKAKKR